METVYIVYTNANLSRKGVDLGHETNMILATTSKEDALEEFNAQMDLLLDTFSKDKEWLVRSNYNFNSQESCKFAMATKDGKQWAEVYVKPMRLED